MVFALALGWVMSIRLSHACAHWGTASTPLPPAPGTRPLHKCSLARARIVCGAWFAIWRPRENAVDPQTVARIHMSLATLFLVNLLVISALAAAAWIISLPLRDASIMDVLWGLGFVALAWIGLMANGGAGPRGWLIGLLTTIWGLRLAIYLAWRKWRQPEDHRYAALRQQFGQRFWWVSLVVVFGLQAIILWVVSLPLAVAALSRSQLNWVDWLGAIIWLCGVTFESVGDFQLARFKANPANRGQVCDRGLWRYTRHPNYFGDFLVWWGFYLIAVAGDAAWWVVVSPLVMSILLMRVSGVGLLERSLVQRTAGYRDYVLRTSAFFPWPPRR